MAKARNTKSTGGRGSAEAIEKRRAARQLNALLTSGPKKQQLDGRTAKRRARLIAELKDGGKDGKPLQPIDFLKHIEDLFGIGETAASLRKQGVKARKLELTPEIQETIEATQKAYGFKSETWKMLGVDLFGADEAPTPAPAPAKKAAKKAPAKKAAKKPAKKAAKKAPRRAAKATKGRRTKK